jgi:hypothetical protein
MQTTGFPMTQGIEAMHRKVMKIFPTIGFSTSDNAPAHKVLSVIRFVVQKLITVIDHPPCSPDFIPNNL